MNEKQAEKAKRQRAAVADETAAEGGSSQLVVVNQSAAASPNKERPLFGHVHEDTLKLLVTLVHEDDAFVVQLSFTRESLDDARRGGVDRCSSVRQQACGGDML